jgi:hypothetical protein
MDVQQIIQWHLMVRMAKRRMRSSLFLREWQHLRSEFETFPEFVELVTSVQCGTLKIKATAMTTLPDPQSAFDLPSFRPEMSR